MTNRHYRILCVIRAKALVMEAQHEIDCGRAESAGRAAKHAATWAFWAHPELREEDK